MNPRTFLESSNKNSSTSQVLELHKAIVVLQTLLIGGLRDVRCETFKDGAEVLQCGECDVEFSFRYRNSG